MDFCCPARHIVSALVSGWPTALSSAAPTVLGFRRGYRNWLRLVLATAGSKLGLGPSELLAITRGGSLIRCPNVGTARHVLIELYVEDEYDLARLGAWQELHSPVVIDIGANVGVFAVDLCERFPRARLFSYEPSPYAFGYLATNVEQNHLSDRVVVCSKAVSDHDGTLEFFVDGASTVNTMYSERRRSGQSRTSVLCQSFDSVISQAGSRIDLVKIDCEGGEFDIILGASDSAWGGVSRLVVEHHAVAGHSWAELETRLRSLGFVVRDHKIRGHEWGLANLSRTH